MAYKPDVNDLRESPSVKIFKNFLKIIILQTIDNNINFKIGKKIFKSVSLKKLKFYDFVVIGTDHSDINKNYILKIRKKYLILEVYLKFQKVISI